LAGRFGSCSMYASGHDKDSVTADESSGRQRKEAG
jgi:hypothetical protein